MTLAWGERKRLIRIAGFADELLNATRMHRSDSELEALDLEIDGLMSEAHALLADSDVSLASEFDRIVVRAGEQRPPDLRAAALAGWLRAEIHVEALDEARVQARMPDDGAKRRLTIGFRSRSQVRPKPQPRDDG